MLPREPRRPDLLPKASVALKLLRAGDESGPEVGLRREKLVFASLRGAGNPARVFRDMSFDVKTLKKTSLQAFLCPMATVGLYDGEGTATRDGRLRLAVE